MILEPKLYDLTELIDATGLPERTVRYYLATLLEAPGGTPGRKSYYDQLTVDRLKLAQQVLTRDYDPKRGEVKPTLRELQDWLAGLSPEQTRELAEMPYRVRLKRPESASAPRYLSAASLSSSKEPRSYSNAIKPAVDKEDKQAETATQYLDRVMGNKPQRQHTPAWQSHPFGADLEIRTRKPLSPEQLHQLQLTGELLKSMLERN